MPAIVQGEVPSPDQGPVLVTVEYRVDQQQAKPFLQTLTRYGRVRRRDGASRWGVFRDLERVDVYVETFVVTSWAEHIRQHERFTRGDRELEDRIRKYSKGDPTVRHLIHAE
jgi:hypothetical protein